MLPKIGKNKVYNDLTDHTRNYLQNQKDALGNGRAKYRFDIKKPNMDPEKYNGEWIWPSVFTVPRREFELRMDGNKRTTVAVVLTLNDNGDPKKKGKVQIRGGAQGYLELDPVNKSEDEDLFAWLELHPLNRSSPYCDKTQVGLFYRIDELKEAKDNRRMRKLRTNAMWLAEGYTDQEVKDFVSAMNWDENEDMEILRDKVESMASEHPEEFEKVIDGDQLKYKACVKRALSAGILDYNALENQMRWSASQELIATFDHSLEVGKNEVERMADWLISAKNGDAVFHKLQKMLSGK